MSTSTQAAPSDLRAAMAATNDVFRIEVIEKRNFDALADVYTANARILPPGGPLTAGLAAIKEFWANFIQSADATTGKLESVEVIPSGDGVVEIGRAVLTLGPAGQDPVHVEVKYVVYWKMEAGRWKWDVDIWNLNS